MRNNPKRLGGVSRRAPRSGDAMSAKVAIVAGGGGPLGHATVLTLAARGLTVVAVDRSESALGDLPEDIRRAGRRHRPSRGGAAHRPDRR
jgi:NAD(P)-dependent dehydrogenase (short-subunit alcohol dehydrogenase family)